MHAAKVFGIIVLLSSGLTDAQEPEIEAPAKDSALTPETQFVEQALFGDAVFGAAIDGLTELSLYNRDGDIIVWSRKASAEALVEGLEARELRYQTWRGRLLRIRVSGDMSLRDWAEATYGSGKEPSTHTQWVHGSLRIDFETREIDDWSELGVLVYTYRPLESEIEAAVEADRARVRKAEEAERRRAKEAEETALELALHADNKFWQDSYSGVDARLDPRVATAMRSAMQKSSWAAALMLSGSVMATGSLAGTVLTKAESPEYIGGAAFGAVLVLVGALLSSSASDDVESVTAPR